MVKRRNGLDRCRYKGYVGMNRWVGLGVVADNIVNIGSAMKSRQPFRSLLDTSRFCTPRRSPRRGFALLDSIDHSAAKVAFSPGSSLGTRIRYCCISANYSKLGRFNRPLLDGDGIGGIDFPQGELACRARRLKRRFCVFLRLKDRVTFFGAKLRTALIHKMRTC